MNLKNIKILEWDIFKKLGIKAGITTRINGFSNQPYSSFNLATHTGDKLSIVEKNRSLLKEYLSIPNSIYCHGVQVHSDFIHTVNMENAGNNTIECDALFTKDKGLLLNIFVADCVPIVLYDKKLNIGMVCHCGWKGTFKKLAISGVETLIKNGSTLENIIAGIGPSIGSCCYNVSEELYIDFKLAPDEGHIKDGEYFLDLKNILKNQLLSVGLRKESMEIMDLCTSCNNDLFYSHRKEGEPSGRFSCYLQLSSK